MVSLYVADLIWLLHNLRLTDDVNILYDKCISSLAILVAFIYSKKIFCCYTTITITQKLARDSYRICNKFHRCDLNDLFCHFDRFKLEILLCNVIALCLCNFICANVLSKWKQIEHKMSMECTWHAWNARMMNCSYKSIFTHKFNIT